MTPHRWRIVSTPGVPQAEDARRVLGRPEGSPRDRGGSGTPAAGDGELTPDQPSECRRSMPDENMRGGARAPGLRTSALEGRPSPAGTWPLPGTQGSLQRTIGKGMITSGRTMRRGGRSASAETSGQPSRCQSPSGAPMTEHVPSNSPPSKLMQRIAVGLDSTRRLMGVEQSSS
jgi:hypothetical protein